LGSEAKQEKPQRKLFHLEAKKGDFLLVLRSASKIKRSKIKAKRSKIMRNEKCEAKDAKIL
jgi:hypothetical protein